MAKQSKSKAKRKTSAWFQRHTHDTFVKKAQVEGKRSRAAFKLTEILDKHGLQLKQDAVVVDLGCAPGSWSAEIAKRLSEEGLLVGIDLLPLESIQGAVLMQADFSSNEGRAELAKVLQGRKANLVLSDMAPEMSGHRIVDQARMIGLNELTLDFAVNHLRENGHLLMKTFMGDGFDQFRKELAGWFRSVKIIKPAASRKDSPEIFLLAQQFRG